MSIQTAQKQTSSSFTYFVSNRTGNWGLKPLPKHYLVPDVSLQTIGFWSINKSLQQQFGKENTLGLWDLLEHPQPIVLAFTSIVNLDQFKALKSLAADITVMGGTLIIATNTNYRQFRINADSLNELNIYYDQEQQLASAFGVYSYQNPLSNLITGIDDDVALPSFFVLNAQRKIAYTHIDNAFVTIENGFVTYPFVRELLTAVYHSGKLSNQLAAFQTFQKVS